MSMSIALPIFMIFAVLLVGVIAIYGILMQDSKKKKNPALTEKKHRLSVEKRYRFLNENFLVRNTFRRVVDQIAALSIYTLEEVHELAVNYFTSALSVSIGLIILGAFVFQDVIATLLCALFAMVMFNVLVMKRIDATHFAVVKEFSSTLSSIRETYTIVGNIPDAIAECHTGKLLPKAMDRIYLILTATDAEDRLEEFYRTVPFPMLQTLAGVCYILNDAGDETNEKGQSAFKNAITLLKNEADLEVRKLTKQKLMFSFLEYLPLIPLPFVGVLKWFLVNNLPGTAVVLNGILGLISQTLIILVAIFSYYYITTVTSPSTVRHNDRNLWIDRLRHTKLFDKKILPDIMPKKVRIKLKWERAFHGALSQKDLPYIYTSKCVYAAVAFLLVFVSLIVFSYLGRQFVFDNIKSASFLASNDMSVDEAERWKALDTEVLFRGYPPNTSNLINNGFIASRIPDLSTMELQEAATRIITKYDQYWSLGYKWWFVLVAMLFGTIAWFCPVFMLNLRKKLVLAEEEEDVLQLQTMLAILRYTNLETMEALYWLSRQSKIHASAITFAYHEYPSDPELAIERLRDKSNLPEFKQICERLLSTVSSVTIREAFADLESERDHMLRIREMVQEKVVEKKRRQCSPISRAPLMVMVVGHFLMPICVLAFNEIMSLAPQLGF